MLWILILLLFLLWFASRETDGDSITEFQQTINYSNNTRSKQRHTNIKKEKVTEDIILFDTVTSDEGPQDIGSIHL